MPPQILPWPSASTVTLTPLPIPRGGVNRSMVSVAASMRPRLPLVSNQSVPSWSRPMPCDDRVRMRGPAPRVSLKSVTCPVRVSSLVTVRCRLPADSVIQALPSLSTMTSWRPPIAPCMPVPGPSDQSLPSCQASSPSRSTGTSYSVTTTRAASPAGRGWSTKSSSESGPRTRASHAASSSLW